MNFRSLLLVTAVCAAVTACNNDTPTTSVEKALPLGQASTAGDYRNLDTALFFAGLWVNEQYVNDVTRTRSPISVEVPENACIIMPARTLKETSLILGFHEGQEVVILKNGDKYEIWDQPVQNKLQDIVMVDENKMQLGFDTFLKLKSGDISKEANPYNIVDILLFAGTYRDEYGGTVEFTKDGKVNGIAGMKVYEAWLDYATSDAVDDQLSMGPDLNSVKDYAFRFNKDTLTLFRLRCIEKGADSVCIESAVGDRLMKLVRQR